MALYEARLLPASGGFDMWAVGEIVKIDWLNGPGDQGNGPQLEKCFRQHMDSEYEWNFTSELDGKIYEQNNGRVFRWRTLPCDDSRPGQCDGDFEYSLLIERDDPEDTPISM